MKIKRLMLSDFGKFHQKEVVLSPGLTILTGANESGKTTLCRFIRSMLYGLERERGIKARTDDYTRYKPWEYGRFQGAIEFEVKGEEYRLFRNFLTTEKEIRLIHCKTGKEIAHPMEFLREQGLVSEGVYINTFWIGNDCATEELLAGELKDYLANLAYRGGKGLNLQKSLAWLAARKKEVLRQVPERELQYCMEQQLSMQSRKDTMDRLRCVMDENWSRQKELEKEIQEKQGWSGQLAAERTAVETEEAKAQKKKRVLRVLELLFFGLFLVSCLLPAPVQAVGCAVCGVAVLTGVIFGWVRLGKEKDTKKYKEELTKRLEENAEQLQMLYQKLTKLLPVIEQDRLRLEQLEEQQQHGEAAAERYEELERKKRELLFEGKALELAAVTLEQLSVELYEEFGEKFAAALSGYAGDFTDGAYQCVTADEVLTLRAVTKERCLELSEVSFGTREQFYLALRFAAADVFDPEKKHLMILDDSFASFDEQRLESAILALRRCGRQVLVLSSTGREEAAAKRMGITYESVELLR